MSSASCDLSSPCFDGGWGGARCFRVLSGVPPSRQKQVARMGHGAFVRELLKVRSRSLGSVEKHFARDDTSVKGVGRRAGWLGFWVSHPCDRNKSQRWGTDLLCG